MPGKKVEAKWRKRVKLFDQQGGLCFYCKRPMVLEVGRSDGRCPPDLATIDHVKPASQGGTLSYENTVAACFRCNNDRSDGEEVNQPRRVRAQARVVWQDV